MEKVACGFSKTGHKEVFLSLDAIGLHCTGLGSFGPPLPILFLCHPRDLTCVGGAVVELAEVYGSTHDILYCLFPDMTDQDWKAIVHKINTQAKQLKSKQYLGNIWCRQLLC